MNHATLTDTINEGTEAHGFGVSDRKGREIGAKVSFEVRVYAPAEEGVKSWVNIAPGTYFVVRYQATRGGTSYGPGFNRAFFGTEKERFAGVEKYLKSAKARAVKTAAAGK